MRALVASPLGFLVGLTMGALGGGGSVLAVPILVYAAGQGARAATTTTLIVVGLAALAGMIEHWRAGRVRAGVGLGFGLAGIGASIGGTALNRRLDPDVLLLAFAGLIVVAAWRMVAGCPSCTRAGAADALVPAGDAPAPVAVAPGIDIDVATLAKLVISGVAVGFITGLFGVGGGFVVVPALTLLLGFSMPEAIGTSLLVVAINAAVALGARAGTDAVEWPLTVFFTVAALGGVVAGTRAADRLPAPRMVRWFAGLLLAIAVYTAARSVLALA